MAMLTREEFNDRIDDLKEYLDQRFGDHSRRIENLEKAAPSSNNLVGPKWGGVIGAALYAFGDFAWRKISGSAQ